MYYDCPTWTYPTHNNTCKCGVSFRHTVVCDSLETDIVVDFYCIFLSEEYDTTLIGSCPYGTRAILPKNVSELKDRNVQCSHLHRKGELCGECEENYTLPVYSYYLGCVKCEDYKYGWVKFIAAAFLPLTLFYLIVIVFRISATSPALNGYILVSQIAATPTLVHLLCTFQQKRVPVAKKFITDLYSVWNLDFFRNFYKPICLFPNITYQQVLILDYAVAVYPLLLIFITYILVKLHDNFAVVVWLWRPFHKCLVHFRRQWNIQSYLINALTTFIVLSYVKILNVSFQFLTFSHTFNMTHKTVNKTYWYYDGRVDMASKDYFPYLILAVSMLLIFNVLPFTLLALYPFKCFQKCLNCLCCAKCKLSLQIFIDTFHGHYKHEMRHFAAIYLAVRFLNLLLLSALPCTSYLNMTVLMFVAILVLLAYCQPYKCKKTNKTDVVMLFVLTSSYLSLIYNDDSRGQPRYPYHLTAFLNTALIGIIEFIPPCYALYLVLLKVLPVIRNKCQCKRPFLRKLFRQKKVEDADECKALLSDIGDTT